MIKYEKTSLNENVFPATDKNGFSMDGYWVWCDSVFGPWERLPEPVLSKRPEGCDNFLVSNTAPCITPEAKILLVYKSRSYQERPYPEFLHGKMLFGVAVADAPWEKHSPILESPLFDGDGYELEGPVLWHDGEVFHLMVKNMSGKVCGKKLSGVPATSFNVIDWNFDMGRFSIPETSCLMMAK